ncbi:hypothetical protein GC174_11875 [bacterium]|nr:hypothetical protein [bacterium]
MTYESAEEAKVLRSIWGQGDLQKTVFAILAPYCRPIVNAQRSPLLTFRDFADMTSYYARSQPTIEATETPPGFRWLIRSGWD